MKKLFSFLLLGLLCSIGTAWAGDVYKYQLNGADVELLNGSSHSGFFSNGSGKHNFNNKFNGCTYDGVSYTSGLKMEGTTAVSWTSTSLATVTIVQSSWSSHTIKFDGNELSLSDASSIDGGYVHTISNVAAGAHSVSRGSGENGLFAIIVAYVDAITGPTIIKHPSSASYAIGATPAALSVTASAYQEGALSYQWYSNTTGTADLENDVAISGATSNILSAENISTAAVGITYFYCVVTEAGLGSTISNLATISVVDVSTITFAKGEEVVGVVPAAFANVQNGESITLPKNFTMYKEGYTMTGWSDGVTTYNPGASYEVSEDKTLTAVFTANTVTLAEHTGAVEILFDFQRKNGAPTVAYEGNGQTGIWVAQAQVKGSTIDVKMDWDVTSGKMANGGWEDWMQINNGTTFSIPSENGAEVTMISYNEDTETTINSVAMSSTGSTGNFTNTVAISSENATAAVAIGESGTYYKYIKVSLPSHLTPGSAINLIDAGELNTTDFRGSFSLKDENYTVEEVAYTGCAALGGTNSTMIGLYAQSKFVAYDSKSDDTDVDIVVWNKNTSNKNLVILVVPEGAEVASCVPETIAVTKSAGLVKSIHMTGRSTLYCSVNSTDVRFCQIVVNENGTTLPVAGEAGYFVNHNKGRIAAEAGSAAFLDGIEYVVSSGAKVLNTTETKINTLGTHYIKFTASSDIRLKVTTNNTAHYYVANSKNGTTNEQAPTANEASNIDLEAGTWYINPAGSDVKITRIEFVEMPTKYDVTFNMQGHGDQVAAQKLEAGEKVVEPTAPTAEGFAFGGWYKEAGCANAWDFDNDLVSEDTELFAKWTGAYTVAYFDGETKLGEEAVIEGQNPVHAAEYQAIAHKSFEGWYSNSDLANEHLIANIAELVVNADMNIYGKWTVNAISASIDVEGWVLENTTNSRSALLAAMTAAGISCDGYDNLDTLNNSKSHINYPYLGLKFKTENAGIDAIIPAGKKVILRVGNMAAAGKVFLNGVEAATIAGSSSDVAAEYEFNIAEETLFRFETTSSGTAVLKGLFIDEAPVYYRALAEDKWGTICLPKDVAAVPANAEFYEIAGKAANESYVELNDVDALEAGKAYLYYSANKSLLVAEMSGVAANAPEANNGLIGVFAETELAAADGAHILSGGVFHLISADATATIGQYRAYLKLDEVSIATAPGRVRIALAENTATAIDNLDGTENVQKFMENGKLFIIRNGVVYDAVGRVVK